MSLGLVWYFSTLVAAFVYLMGSPLAKLMSFTELVVAAIPLGTIAGAWIVYFVASLISNLGPQTLIISNLIIIWIVAEYYKPFMRNFRTALAKGYGGDRKDFFITLAVVGALSFVFWPLYSTRMIPERDGKIWSGGSCWADLPIHMHIAESFLQGRNTDISFTDMTSPVFAGEKMYYPFLPDFHAAVMKRLGGTLRESFLWTGFLMACALFAFIYLLTVRVTRSRLGGVLAILLTILAGGMGGVNIALRDGIEGAINTDTAQNDVSGDGKIFWFQFVAHVLLPQRGANFAYPMVLAAVLMVWRASDMTTVLSISDRRSLLVHAAAFTATLPLVQAHAFIAAGVIIGAFFVLDAHKWAADHRLLLSWAYAGLTALALGGPQLALFQKHVAKGSGGQFTKFGWIYLNHDLGRERGFFYFWWMALGPAFPLFLLAIGVYAFDALQAALLGASLAKADGSSAVNRYLFGSPSGLPLAPEDAAAEASASSRAGASASAEAAPASSPTASASGSPAPVNPYTGSPAEGPDDNIASVTYGYLVGVLGPRFDDLAQGRIGLGFKAPDAAVSHLNGLSLTGRALDTLKLALGALAVFLLGNYVNFQPWDRDNCKLLNIWLIVASALSGSLLAVPFEFLLGQAHGVARLANWTGGGLKAVREGFLGAPSTAASPKSSSASGNKRGPVGFTAAAVLAGVSALCIVLCCTTGTFMILREFRQFHVLLDEDQKATAAFISDNLAPKANFLHKDVHITPSGTLAGRSALISYNGWMWSHGYNYGDRDRDRQYVLANCLKDSDAEAYNALRRWGVRYVLCEWCTKHHRPREVEYNDAIARKKASPGDQSITVPAWDPDMFLDGQLKRIYSQGRYDVLEVLGYGFPPS